MCLVAATLAGCSPKSAAPSAVVKSFFDALKGGDYKAATALIANAGQAEFPSESEPGGGILKAYFSRLSYEMGSSEVKGDQATVNVKLTVPDLASISTQVIAQALPTLMASATSGQPDTQAETMVLKMFEDAIKDAKAPTVSTDVPVGLTKVQGKWLIGGDAQFANALTGNALDALQKAFSPPQ